MLLQVSNISKAYSERDVLIDCSFHIEKNEKCALVGINGAGKSTLLKIIMGEVEADSGSVSIQSGTEIGYLSQLQNVDYSGTIKDELYRVKADILEKENQLRGLEVEMKYLSGDELDRAMQRYSTLTHEFEEANGYAVKSEITGVLKGLGFQENEFDNPVASLSGGEKTRVALGRILLTRPQLLILDEPTNHLDLKSIEWLEGYIRTYNGTVLIVAHDRYFLDRTVNKVIEIEAGKCTVFKGNYSAYAEKRKALRESERKAYLENVAEIERQEAIIKKLKSFNREKSIKRAESREKLLSKMERVKKPVELDSSMRIKISPSIKSGKDVLTVYDLSKSFPGNLLFQNLDFEVKRGERVAILGDNGTGKTTLLKILMGEVNSDSGGFILGTNVVVSYYDQEHQVLNPGNTLFDEISDAYPDMDNTDIRNTLAAFLFTGEDVFKQIKDLSGGERGRVSLAKLMLSNANFLILDEPTNHLDIDSKEILEEALNSYEGTVLFVSHDRYFINSVSTRILNLTDHRVINYIGNYDYYLEKREELENAYLGAKSDSNGTVKAVTDSKLEYQKKKAEQAELRKKEAARKRCEEEIDRLEVRSREIDQELSKEEVACDPKKCLELSEEQSEINTKLEELMEKWEELQY